MVCPSDCKENRSPYDGYCYLHRPCRECGQNGEIIGISVIDNGIYLHYPNNNCQERTWVLILPILLLFLPKDISNIIKEFLYRKDFATFYPHQIKMLNKNIKLLVRYQYNIDIDTHHDLRLYRRVFEKKYSFSEYFDDFCNTIKNKSIEKKKKSFKPLDFSIKKSSKSSSKSKKSSKSSSKSKKSSKSSSKSKKSSKSFNRRNRSKRERINQPRHRH
jgi:hypothetical protein